MMGKKTLADIRTELKHVRTAKGQLFPEWVEQELQRLDRTPEQDQRFLETLRMLRDALAQPRGKKPTRSRKKATG
jgi:hypothetical protein